MAKEMQYTCKRDGTVWYGPDLSKVKPPKKPSRMLKSGIEMQAKGSRMSLGGGKRSVYEQQLANIQREQAEYDAWQRGDHLPRCPQCGSQKYDSKKVRA